MKLLILRLVYRTGLLILALTVPDWLDVTFGPWSGFSLINVIWISYCITMLFKLIPVKRSLGRNKILPKYYAPVDPPPTQARMQEVRREMNRGAIRVAALWLSVNAVLFWLYLAGVLEGTHMVLISLFYYVADLICIVFFCPFQVLLMKNRCCVSCRIYSWDALMMVTPLVVLGTPFSWGLLAIALVILIRWEVAFRRYPERFSHQTNSKLKCISCTEHSCRIKQPGVLGVVRAFMPQQQREQKRKGG